MSAAKKEFTAQELNPLSSLDQWEEAVLERYPEPGIPAKTKEEFRNYEEPGRDTVREFYRLNHTYQTYDFVMDKKSDYLRFDKKEMPVWNAFEFLNQLVDDSDPDTDLDQFQQVGVLRVDLRRQLVEHAAQAEDRLGLV